MKHAEQKQEAVWASWVPDDVTVVRAARVRVSFDEWVIKRGDHMLEIAQIGL